MPMFIVNTIISYRVKYAVEAPSADDARTILTDHEGLLHELTQRCLGEVVTDVTETSKEDIITYLQYLKEDKDEMSSYWMDEKLINRVSAKEIV